MYKVSVVVPFYNVEDYFEKCLYRLCRQTLDNIEIILVNDGSQDGSHAIAEKYVKEYPDLFKLYVKENGGLSDARNYGIERAAGEYIGFIDSDDYPEVDMYEKLYHKAKEKDSDIVVCNYNRVKWDMPVEGGVKVTVSNVLRPEVKPGYSVHEVKENLRYASPYAWNKLYRRHLFDEIRYPKGQVYEDSATTYKLFVNANRIDYVEEPLINYRLARAGSITATVNEKIMDVLKSVESNTVYFKEHGYFEELHDELEYLCIMHIYARIYSLKGSAPLGLKIRFISRSHKFLNQNYPNWRTNPYYIKTRMNAYTADQIKLYNKVRDHKWLVTAYVAVFPVLTAVKNFLKRQAWKAKLLNPDSQSARRNAGIQIKSNQLTDEQLKLLQSLELDILKVVDRFCEENQLRYYLSEGTLLGAMRHHGFIPWDDDVDIAMPREDYEKFLQLWGEKEVENCVLLHQSTFNAYYLPFAKVVMHGEDRFKSKRMVPDRFHGPNIDVFPLDEGPDIVNLQQLKYRKYMRRYRNILLVKSRFTRRKKTRLKYGLKAMLYSYSHIHKKLNGWMTAFQGQDCPNIVNHASSYPIDKECMPREWYGEPRRVQFEDVTLNVPCEAEKVLTVIYGDYMTPPPPEKQVCRHAFYWVGGE